MKTVDIYIDTSIKGPRRRAGHYMYIVATQTNKGPADAGDSKYLEETTENQASLKALEAALKRIPKPCHILIHTECQYLSSALKNRWYESWKENNWQTVRKEPVSDAETWKSVVELLQKHEVEVILRQPHTYREWMQRTLKEKEDGGNAGTQT